MRARGGFLAIVVLASAAWLSAAPQRGAVPVPPVTPPPPPPTGVIAGRVVDAVSKAPLARARVQLSADCEAPAPPGGPPCQRVLPQNRVVVTGDDGRFRIPELPAASNFLLKAARTGYAPSGYGELPPATPPAFIALKAGEARENLTIELAPEVVLAGMVQDEDGSPFAGALVEALRATYVEGRRELVTVAEALSDDRGQFRLAQMPPGQYYVSAIDPAFANVGDAAGPLFYSPTYYPSATTPEEATRITLDPGVSREAIVIRLKLIRPVRVGGKLRPQGDVLLSAGAIELGPKRNDQYASLSSYRVDIRPDGSYQFANVPPGSYVIRARGETQADNLSMFGTYTLPVTGTDRSGIDIVMNPGAIVSGFVEWERARAPIPADRRSIVVRAPMTDGSLSGDAPTGNLQPDDTFRLRGVLQGLHYIRVENLPPPWTLKRVELNGADVTDTQVEFQYGQIETGVRIVFAEATTALFGTIIPGRGDVLHGYAVIAFSTNPVMHHPRSRFVALQRPMDLMGHYRVEGLPPGDYWVAVTRDYDEGDVGNPRVLRQLAQAPGNRRVQIRDGEFRLVDLRPVLRPF